MRDPRSGASRATQLESLLRDSGVERLVVLGLATDYCVKDTVLDARRLGFVTEVPLAGIRAVNLKPDDGAEAIAAMAAAGAHVL